MQINQLSIQNFRNYEEQTLTPDPQCNIIIGENAAGKTNLLEAILYLSHGKSQRAKSDRELIQFQKTFAKLKGNFQTKNRDFTIEAELWQGHRRKLSINRIPQKTALKLGEICATVFFCPEDLSLIRESAAVRRRFLDIALCQLRPRYAAALSDYKRCHEHKTRILRDRFERPDLLSTLPDFNERMIQSGAVIIHYRAQYIQRLKEYAASNHQKCSGGKESLSIVYKTVSAVTDPLTDTATIAEQLCEHMQSHQQAELDSGLCLSGPHKDDFTVSINDRDAKTFASQGQTRTAALSLKLAEREITKNILGEYPLLLLDDVLSELDSRRQEFVLNRIANGQIFITCCEDDRPSGLLSGKVFHIQDGHLQCESRVGS